MHLLLPTNLLTYSSFLTYSSNPCVDPVISTARAVPGYISSGSAGFRSGTLNGLAVELLPIGAEQVPSCYTHAFDTVVMINVIEHTFNAFATLETAHRLLKPGGLILFAERVVRMAAHDQLLHPVRLTVSFYDAFLSEHFDEVHRHRGVMAESYTKPFVETEIYFIGRKKKATGAAGRNDSAPLATPYGYGG